MNRVNQAICAFAIAAAVSGCEKSNAILDGLKDASRGPDAPTALTLAERAQPTALRTSDQIHRKVILIDDCHIYRDPNADLLGISAPFFSHRFLFGEQRGWFQIGSDPQTPVGWIQAENAKAWDTRLALRLIKNSLIYETADDAISKANGGSPKAFASGGASVEECFPLVESKTVNTASGTVVVSKLLFVGRTASGKSLLGGVQAASFDSTTYDEVRTVEIVICIDLTGSMQNVYLATRAAIEKSMAEVKAQYPSVHVEYSLLGFKDFDADSDFETRWLARRVSIDDAIKSLTNDSVGGGGDAPEAVFSAVDELLKNGFSSTTPLTQRIGIVVAQTEAHESGFGNPLSLTAEGLAKRAKENGVRLLGLQVPLTMDRSSASYDPKLTRQLRELSGEVYSAKDLASFTKSLNILIGNVSRTGEVRTEVYNAVATGTATSASELRSNNFTKDELADAFTFLKVNSPNIFARTSSAVVEHAAEGWIVTRIGNEHFADTYVSATRPELQMYIAELLHLSGVLSDVDSIFRLQAATGTAHKDGFFAKADANESMAGFLSSKGAYVAKGSILNLSRTQLLALTESQKLEIQRKLDLIFIPALYKALNSDQWRDGHGYVMQSCFP